MTRSVTISAPSRLHFGLFALRPEEGRRYGGVGAMVERPGLQMSFAPAGAWRCSGLHAERVHEFALRWASFQGRALLPACEVQVMSAPPDHVGLGVGTQLALSVAAGLNSFCDLPGASPQELALSVGRADRSAVGTYGFAIGGLIVERGKLASEPISPLDVRIELPSAWRFVLLRPLGRKGLSGIDEATAMDALPVVPPGVTDALIAEVRDHLVPAAATANFAEFAESVYRYGYLAGSCFAARQGGPFNGPVLAGLVQRLRNWGVAGVGQSSWGPTLFAVCEDQAAAEALVVRIALEIEEVRLEVLITPARNRGAEICRGSTESELAT